MHEMQGVLWVLGNGGKNKYQVGKINQTGLLNPIYFLERQPRQLPAKRTLKSTEKRKTLTQKTVSYKTLKEEYSNVGRGENMTQWSCY